MGYLRVYLKVTVEDLAQASGKSVWTIRRHIEKGVLDAGDLGAIHRWLLKHGKVDKEGEGPS